MFPLSKTLLISIGYLFNYLIFLSKSLFWYHENVPPPIKLLPSRRNLVKEEPRSLSAYRKSSMEEGSYKIQMSRKIWDLTPNIHLSLYTINNQVWRLMTT